MYPKVFLKPGKERPLASRHHWVFSGSLKSRPELPPGELVQVLSADHRFLGTGVYHPRTSIAVRVLRFDPGPVDAAFFRDRFARALAGRQALFPDGTTDAWRLVNAEGDALPGLVVDRYGPGLVVQLHTAGLDARRADILEALAEVCRPDWVLERSDSGARIEEGLPPVVAPRLGTPPETGLEIQEYGRRFQVDPLRGQKTGFFLDQRANRRLIGRHSRGARVLNAFGYSGGFSVHAACGGARETDTVDLAPPAVELARTNLARNDCDPQTHRVICADAFAFLRQVDEPYDVVVLDPPAFAKHQGALAGALRGYKDLNLYGLRAVRAGGWLLTCSCSPHLTWSDLQKVLFYAALDAGREVQIIGRRGQPADHPVNLFHPESEYLKGLWCRVG